MKKKLSSPKKSSTSISRKKVGDFKAIITKKDPKSKKDKRTTVFYSYADCESDFDGWVDCKRFLPADFDLVHMRLKRNRTIPGWVNGSTWEGLRIKPDDEVKYWKRKEEDRD